VYGKSKQYDALEEVIKKTLNAAEGKNTKPKKKTADEYDD
jgi:hypothetical protein